MSAIFAKYSDNRLPGKLQSNAMIALGIIDIIDLRWALSKYAPHDLLCIIHNKSRNQKTIEKLAINIAYHKYAKWRWHGKRTKRRSGVSLGKSEFDKFTSYTKLLCGILHDILNHLRGYARKDLFGWVYQRQWSLLKYTNQIKLPPLEKVALIEALLSATQSNLSWLNSQLLHLYAFRGDHIFKDANRRHNNPVINELPWGPLYRRVSISKGRKTRIIHIPNLPLRRIQRAILRTVGNGVARSLPDFVAGAGNHQNPTIFSNALRHLGQHFIVSLDLKDFFPSVTLDDIMRGLLSLKSPMLNVRTEVKKNGEIHGETRVFNWEYQSALLIAQLCTYHRRLPQGAPTSPLMANLAFLRYDERIRKHLGQDFVYTRYFDDITVSVSRSIAGKNGFNTPTDLLNHLLEIIDKSLEGSRFRLNPRKSRAGRIRDGHRITGLRLYSDQIDLPRKRKRRLRTLVHLIDEHGFVPTARKWIEGHVHSQTRVHERYHDHRRQNRRMSTERLACLMLRHLCPELTVLVRNASYAAWRLQAVDDLEEYRNRDKWPLLEKLLTYLWQDQVVAKKVADGSIVIEHGADEVCRITADRNLDFFLLSKRGAVSCVEFWHYLNGMIAFLGVKHPDDAFEPIRQQHTRLLRVSESITIEAPEKKRKPKLHSTEKVKISITPSDDNEKLAEEVKSLLEEYRQWSGSDEESSIGDRAKNSDILGRPVVDSPTLNRWLQAAYALTVGSLSLLPAPARLHRKPEGKDTWRLVFEFLRITVDQQIKNRHREYWVELFFPQFHGLKSLETEPLKIQRAVLDDLLQGFQQSQSIRIQSGTPEWRKQQHENVWRDSFSNRMNNAVDELLKNHAALRSDKTQKRIFLSDSEESLVECNSSLREITKRGNSRKCWKSIFTAGHDLIECTTEMLEGEHLLVKSGMEEARIGDHLVKCLQSLLSERDQKEQKKIFTLRNRFAHKSPHPKRRGEWVAIQKFTAAWIGRNWRTKTSKDHPKFYAEDDLDLTPHEATEIKIILIERMATLLGNIQKRIDPGDWLKHIEPSDS